MEYVVRIVGRLDQTPFHIAKTIVEDLLESCPEKISVEYEFLLEFDWRCFAVRMKSVLGGVAAHLMSENVMVFINGSLIGNHRSLAEWSLETFGYESLRPPFIHIAVANQAYSDFFQHAMVHQATKFAFMDVKIAEETIGRLIIMLYANMCPKACENFLTLCGGLQVDDTTITYKGSRFHRLVQDGWIQGGDILPGKRSRFSIYGERFEDESFAIKHDRPGILGMCNEGPHTNGCQFYLTLRDQAWMDKKLVAFGRVIEGYDVLMRLNQVGTAYESPTTCVSIYDCGPHDQRSP